MVHGLVRGLNDPMMTLLVLVSRVIRNLVNNGSREQKSETIGFGRKNRHIVHCLFRFKLTFRSRLVLGCCETCAETSTKSSWVINTHIQTHTHTQSGAENSLFQFLLTITKSFSPFYL